MNSALSLTLGVAPFSKGDTIPGLPVWWYAADKQTVSNGAIISTFTDSSGNNRSLFSSGSPLMSNVNGFAAIQLDGIDDRFDSGASNNVPVNGFSNYTIGIVSTCEDNLFAPVDPPRNCLVYFHEIEAWGTVNLSPFQSSVMMRYGTQIPGNLPTYNRPSNIGNAITSTVWIKNGSTETLYINGDLVATFSGKSPTIAATENRLKIGFTDPTNTYYKGKLLEAAGYNNSETGIPLANYFKIKYGL